MKTITLKTTQVAASPKKRFHAGHACFALLLCTLCTGCKQHSPNTERKEKKPLSEENSQNGKTVSLRADYWFPFNGHPSDENPGFIIDIAQEIFENAGYSIDYKILPWSRAVLSVRNGKHDGLVGTFKSDVPDFVFPQNEQGTTRTIFLVKKGNPWRYQALSSLSKIRLGVVGNYGYGFTLDEYIDKNKTNTDLIDMIHGNNVIKRNLKRLLLGRIDAVVDAELVLEHVTKQQGWTDRFTKAGIASEDKVYIAFSPNNPKSQKYAKLLSDGMPQLRDSGKYKTILKKYGIDSETQAQADR